MVLRSTDGTPRILFLVRILSAAALLTPLLSQPVLAECPEEVWAGDLTTVGVAGMGDGIGGSGLTSEMAEADADGIGGSGLYGTLTGFGSLCVNGERIPYDESVEVSVDSVGSEVAALAVGQVVRIEAQAGERGREARKVDVQHELIGPITSRGKDLVEVMGQRVAVEARMLPSEIDVGDRVAVSGLRRADGVVVASRIDAAKDSQPDLVRGTSGSGGAGELRMDSVVVDTSALSGVSITQGREVFKGTWDSESKRLSAKARSASPRFDADARSANLEGYVARDAAGRLHVDGISLEGAHQRLEPGTRVRVRATFSGGGMRWQARAIRSLREGPMIRGLNRNLRAPVSPEAALLLKVAPPHQRPTEKPPASGPQSGPGPGPGPPRHHVPRPGSDIRPPHPNQPSPRDVIGPRGGRIRPGGGLPRPNMPPPPMM